MAITGIYAEEFRIRLWLTKAVEAAGAEYIGGSIIDEGCSEISFELDGQTYGVKITHSPQDYEN